MRKCSVKGCDKKHESKGLCGLHYKRFRKTGSTELPTPEQKFWAKVKRGDDCWLWTGARTQKGYGQVTLKGRAGYAHRYSYELHKGPIPEGMCVCHTCDNPPCVNPDHLWLGTYAENMADCVSKGRLHDVRGESHPRAKLTTGDVLDIRSWAATGISRAEIARCYCVSGSAICNIVNRERWSHVN